MQTRIISQTTTTWLTRVCDLSNIRRNLIKFTTVSCCARLVRRRRGQINLFSYIVLFQQGLKWRASTQHRLQDDRHASPLSVVTCVVSISLRSSSVARSRADFWAQTFQDITFNTFSKNIYNFLWPSGVHIVCRELSGVFSWLYSLSFHYRISSPSKKNNHQRRDVVVAMTKKKSCFHVSSTMSNWNIESSRDGSVKRQTYTIRRKIEVSENVSRAEHAFVDSRTHSLEYGVLWIIRIYFWISDLKLWMFNFSYFHGRMTFLCSFGSFSSACSAYDVTFFIVAGRRFLLVICRSTWHL